MEVQIFFALLLPTVPIVSEGALPTTMLKPLAWETKANCSCGKFLDKERTKRGEMTWVATLVNKTDVDNEPLCWGSLINDKYILSAAHCTSKYLSENVEVLVDSPYQNVRREVASIKNHPGFVIENSHFDNDISLIKLRTPVDLEIGGIVPVCLPPEVPRKERLKFQFENYTNHTLECNYAGNQDQNVLSMSVFKGYQIVGKNKTHRYEKLGLPRCKDEACHKLYPDRIKAQFLCAEVADNAGALRDRQKCNGDSGGALMYSRKMKSGCDPDFNSDSEKNELKFRYLQIGISSSQKECFTRTPKSPLLLFTRISRYRTWIRENTEDGTYCTNNP